MNICLVYNPSAGNAGPRLKEVVAVFERHPVRLTTIVLQKGFEQKVRQAVGAGADCVVAAGGDGTVNTVARCAVEHDVPLGVLPLGTLNHFAKDMGLPLVLARAVKVIVAGHSTRIDYATVNGELFVNNSSVGLYPRTVLERERLQSRLGKWPAAAIALTKTIMNVRTPRLTFEIDGVTRSIKTPLAFIGNNRYHLKAVGFANRKHLIGGKLFLYVIRANRPTALLRLAILALFGKRLKHGDYMLETGRLVIRSQKEVLHVAMDGEVAKLRQPLKYQIHPAGLRVLIDGK